MLHGYLIVRHAGCNSDLAKCRARYFPSLKLIDYINRNIPPGDRIGIEKSVLADVRHRATALDMSFHCYPRRIELLPPDECHPKGTLLRRVGPNEWFLDLNCDYDNP